MKLNTVLWAGNVVFVLGGKKAGQLVLDTASDWASRVELATSLHSFGHYSIYHVVPILLVPRFVQRYYANRVLGQQIPSNGAETVSRDSRDISLNELIVH